VLWYGRRPVSRGPRTEPLGNLVVDVHVIQQSLTSLTPVFLWHSTQPKGDAEDILEPKPLH